MLREGDLQDKGRPEVVHFYKESSIDDIEKVLIMRETELDVSTGETVVEGTGDVEGLKRRKR